MRKVVLAAVLAATFAPVVAGLVAPAAEVAPVAAGSGDPPGFVIHSLILNVLTS